MSIDRAIRDTRRIVTSGGFNSTITFIYPGGQPISVQGVASRHHLTFDQDGYPINSTNAHVLLSETALVQAGIIVRNSRDEVQLEGCLVSWTDGTGAARTYKIVQVRPSETLGLIVCIIGRYGTN